MENGGLDEAIIATEKLRAQFKQDEYSKLRNEREKATFSMMMKMNPEALTNIRKEFFARRDSVTLEEFIYIIQKHLINKNGDNKFVMETAEQREFGTNMYELFKDIDVNGDKMLEWQEFTSFTVEKANLLNKRAKLASIAHYHDSSESLDVSAKYRHRHDISRFVNLPTLGQFAMVEDHKNSIFVFNSRIGKLITTINTDSAPIAIETIPDKERQLLVTSGADMTLSTFSLDDPNPKRKYKVNSTWATPGVQMAVAYSKDSNVLYSGATNGNIYSWNWQKRSLLSTMPGHTDIVMNLIVLKKLNNVASASLDKSLGVWDSHTNEQILKLVGHKKGVFDLCYNPSYRLIFSCGFEHDACVWSPFVNSMVYRLKGHHASLVGVQTVDNSPEIFTADTSGVIKLWDVRNFQCVQTFSVNLSGQDTKDNSKLTCFFHTKLPSSNTLQKEDDSRIYAASKMLFSFDQARVVHEATTDYTNVFWVEWNDQTCVIITASERNVIVWDALIGSKTFTHTDICSEEISACCLDDRKRKIIIGDVTGRIGVYNYSSGAFMKSVHHANPSVVIALEYFNETKRFIAGYSNGLICLYDENVLEECHLIRTFESLNRHPEMLSLKFASESRTVVTCGESSDVVRLWDYDSGKCETELRLLGGAQGGGAVYVSMCLLSPLPLIATSDTSGNVIFWGGRDIKWQGLRIAGFLNQTPYYADYEPLKGGMHSEEGEEAPRRALPPEFATILPPFSVRDSLLVGGTGTHSPPSPISPPSRSPPSRQRGLRASFSPPGGIDLDRILLEQSRREVQQMHSMSERKWGSVSAASCMCFAPPPCPPMLITGDDMGSLRCFDLTDMLDDLRVDALLSEGQNHAIQGRCRTLTRTTHNALPPVVDALPVQGDDFDTGTMLYLLGRGPADFMGHMGVNFNFSLYAHNDRIISVTVFGGGGRIGETGGIISSGGDRLVKLWTFTGEPLGVLLQSVPPGVRARNWGVEIKIDEIVNQERGELDSIIARAKRLDEDPKLPDIRGMDFKGMQLGAESAEFSRSVLRQRIEKSARILGLDIMGNHTGQSTGIGGLHGGGRGLDEGSVEAGSSVSSKSIVEALREVKSPNPAVDYELKTKQMSYIQQKRKHNKLLAVAKNYEDKTGVRVKPPPSASSLPPLDEEESEAKSTVDLDKLLVAGGAGGELGGGVEGGGSLASSMGGRDEASVNRDLYSLDSVSQYLPPPRAVSPARLKLLDSIQKAHEKGARTQSIAVACRKFTAFAALDNALQSIADTPFVAGRVQPPSAPTQLVPRPEDIEQLRKEREKKHKLTLTHRGLTVLGHSHNSSTATSVSGNKSPALAPMVGMDSLGIAAGMGISGGGHLSIEPATEAVEAEKTPQLSYTNSFAGSFMSEEESIHSGRGNNVQQDSSSIS